jgi:iron complex outermembrane receptor protein
VLKISLTLLAIVISGQVHSQALQSDTNQIQQESKAQSKEKSKEKDIERIIVTGSRIAESIDEVTASITVITKKNRHAAKSFF